MLNDKMPSLLSDNNPDLSDKYELPLGTVFQAALYGQTTHPVIFLSLGAVLASVFQMEDRPLIPAAASPCVLQGCLN